MLGTSSLFIKNANVIIECSSSISFNVPTVDSVTFSGSGSFEVTPSDGSYGLVMLPSLKSFGGTPTLGYGQGLSMLKPLTSFGNDTVYVPPTPQEGFAYLPSLFSNGIMKTESIMTGMANLPSLQSKGGEGPYGEGLADLPALISYGIEGPGPYVANFYSYVYAKADVLSVFETVVFLNSSGQVTSSFSGTREFIRTMLETLQASEEFLATGEFSVSVNSLLVGLFSALAQVGNTSVLNQESRTWAINLNTYASSQYDGYGFNSIYENEGVYFGIADDGIYQLDGTSDDGKDIVATIEFGKSDYGSASKKRIPNVYVGISSTGKVFLKLETGGTEYTYEARSSKDEPEVQRVDPGLGLTGNYFNITFVSVGDDFELEGITFNPIILSRKIQ